MIDYFTLALTHGLMLIAIWRLAFRPELDADDASDGARVRPWNRSRASAQGDAEAVSGDSGSADDA